MASLPPLTEEEFLECLVPLTPPSTPDPPSSVPLDALNWGLILQQLQLQLQHDEPALPRPEH